MQGRRQVEPQGRRVDILLTLLTRLSNIAPSSLDGHFSFFTNKHMTPEERERMNSVCIGLQEETDFNKYATLLHCVI